MAPSRSIIFQVSCALILYELLLVRILGVVLFGPQAHLAIALAILGGGIGASLLYARPNVINSTHKQGILYLLLIAAIAAACSAIYISQVPLTHISADVPVTFQERVVHYPDLVNTPLFCGLILIVIIPFIVGGILLAACFTHGEDKVGSLYSADLIGAALGAPLFIFVLSYIPAPVCTLIVCALFLMPARSIAPVGAVKNLVSIALMAICAMFISSYTLHIEYFPIRYAAGYQESSLIYSRWTPISRVGIFKNPFTKEESIVLDNGSASPIIQSAEEKQKVASMASRGLVYFIHPPGKAAIIGAGAGPEVAAAESYGYSDILAIDLVGHVFDVLRQLYTSNPFNPFNNKNFRAASGDGRIVLAQDQSRFDTIQIVHANIWSLNGVLSNVWSPAHLETREAFQIFLHSLQSNGILSIAKGSDTIRMIPTAFEALKRSGIPINEIQSHLVYLHIGSNVLLVKPEPWTDFELNRIESFATQNNLPVKFIIHPYKQLSHEVTDELSTWPIMSDDKPYSDTPMFLKEFITWLVTAKNSRIQNRTVSDAPLAYVYSIFGVQFVIVTIVGLVLCFGPLMLKRQRKSIEKSDALYSFLVGFGFIALELVLMNKFVLIEKDPMIAVAATLCGFLLFAGLGAQSVASVPNERLVAILKQSLYWIILIGTCSFYLFIPLTAKLCSVQSTFVSFVAIMCTTAPLAFALGVPFASYFRIRFRDQTEESAPWLWAINCWASVFASFASVMIARFYGYSYAFSLGVTAYACALLIVARLPKDG